MNEYLQKVLDGASKNITGTKFEIETKTSYYTDERGFQHADTFPALTFIDAEGSHRFLSAHFCWWA